MEVEEKTVKEKAWESEETFKHVTIQTTNW